MHAPPTRPRVRRAEPDGTILFLLFFGSLIAAGVLGVWLWNQNDAVRQGRAFGTPNQVGAGAAAAAAGTSGQPGGQQAVTAGAAASGAAAGVDPALVTRGQQLATQLTCVACHTTTGQQSLGPTWKGLAGKQVELASGQNVTADDAYLRESILQPDAKVARGFAPGVMSAAVGGFQSQLQQGDTVDALIAYIKSLK